jgi:hypothetical protein
VAGAGSAIYNGTYEILANGSYQKTGTPTTTISFDSEYGEWLFYNSGGAGYYASGNSSTLPLTGWTAYGNGTGTAPTITVGACS